MKVYFISLSPLSDVLDRLSGIKVLTVGVDEFPDRDDLRLSLQTESESLSPTHSRVSTTSLDTARLRSKFRCFLKLFPFS